MVWQVAFADEFHAEYLALSEPVQDELLLAVRLLEVYGPKTRSASCGYAQGFEVCEHEGTAVPGE
jgi:hypothetical protein